MIINLWILSFFIFSIRTFSETKKDTLSVEYLQIVREEFGNWAAEYNRNYTSPSEFSHRFDVYLENKLKVDQHNSDSSKTYTMGINKFSDLTDQEYMALFKPTPRPINPLDFMPSFIKDILGFLIPTKTTLKLETGSSPNYDYLPIKKIDWVDKGALAKIRDQQSMGSCYAFAAIAAVEAAYFIKTGQTIVLSEQQMMDCGLDSELKMGGGSGAMLEDVGTYVVKYGLHSGDQFKYKNKEDQCYRVPTVVKAKTITNGFANSFELLSEVAKGPVVAQIEWNADVRAYKSGVFDIKYPCGIFPNHAVTIVGYDVTAPIPYLKIRNSHGETVGDKGYFLFALRDAGDSAFCGLNGGKEFRPVLE